LPTDARNRAITFRESKDADLEFQFQVYACTRLEELAPLQWDEATTTAFLNMQFYAQHTYYHEHYATADYLIVLIDGEPAGRLYVWRSESELRIMDIALLSGFRNAGIGTRMISDLMTEAREAGRAVRLHVESFNRARNLYARLGFRKIADEGIYWFMEWSAPIAGVD
jgi:ribosomal protein S18 acetylase RimI-like enzyme